MDEFQSKYIEDANDLIINIESEIFALESNPDDNLLIEEIFRVMHTLKGSAGMFGFEKTEKITHKLESVYDLIRSGELKINKEIIDVTFETLDVLKELLSNREELDETSEQKYNKLIGRISSIDGKKDEEKDVKEGVFFDEENENDTDNENPIYIYIRFNPLKDVFLRGIKPQSIFNELSELGEFIAIPELEQITDINNFNVLDFYLSWDILMFSLKNRNEIEDVFLFYEPEEFELLVAEELPAQDSKFYSDYIEVSHEKMEYFDLITLYKTFSLEKINEKIEQKEERKKEITVEEKSKEVINEIKQKKDTVKKDKESIRVSSEKLDELINLVSELVIVNSQLNILANEVQNEKLTKALKQVEKLSKRFRDNALGLRLVPLEVLTIKFQRLIRDLSNKLNKKINFVTEGMNTELDKTIINKIENPLMHILRNSMDHGIEDAETRKNLNKPEEGTIRLIAFYSGANVFIQVQDDGRGIKPEVIREKAIAKKLISDESKLTDKELFDIIFQPGFSTAQSLTEVSGRGVGMDVVKTQISELRGEIDIDSEINLGTSVTFKLPLTLSIIDTLMVYIKNNPFLIPLSHIEICTNTKDKRVKRFTEGKMVFKDEQIPVICLRTEFDLEKPDLEKAKLVIVNIHERKYGVLVDRVEGEHQAVIKPLGDLHKHQEYLSGVSILGDGRLALILDLNKLIRKKIMKLNYKDIDL